MALEAVGSVTEAEEAAQAVIARAQTQAQEILAQAERDGRAKLDVARQEAQKEVRALLDKAQKDGVSAGEATLAQAAQEADKLRAGAKAHIPAAAARIVERVKEGGGG